MKENKNGTKRLNFSSMAGVRSKQSLMHVLSFKVALVGTSLRIQTGIRHRNLEM